MRFWEIDFFRGIAAVLMVIFNWSFALSYFRIYTVDGGWFFWFLFPRLIGGAFIFIAGVSFAVSYSKLKGKSKAETYKKYLFRGAKIFSLGLLITIITWLFVPPVAIFFGILHLIGVSVIIAPFFTKVKGMGLLFLGLAIILIGFYISSLTFSFPWLLWLGFAPAGFRTLDYFPLLPWFGVMLLGIFAGSNLYAKEKRRFSIGKAPGWSNIIRFLGRRSILIYLLHQPVLIALLYALGFNLF